MDRWMDVIQFHYQCGSCLSCKQWYQHDKHTICEPSKLPSKYFIIVWQRGDGAVYCCFTALYKQKIGQSVCQLFPKSSSALINVTSQRGVRAFDLIASSLVFEMYLNGDHLCISRSTTHAKQRVGLKRHLCGSSWPPVVGHNQTSNLSQKIETLFNWFN